MALVQFDMIIGDFWSSFSVLKGLNRHRHACVYENSLTVRRRRGATGPYCAFLTKAGHKLAAS